MLQARLGLIKLEAVELESAAMERLEGRYELASGMRFAVVVEEGELYVKPEGESRAVMIPHSATKFFSTDRENIYEIDFAPDEGTVKVTVGGQVINGIKVGR